MEINEPQITIESLMDKIREGARLSARPNGGDETNASSATASSSGHRAANGNDDHFPALTRLDAVQLALQPGFEPHADDRYHANDLLQYHDRNFIQNAYRAILKRGPDATGYRSFIESLRNGRLNRLDVLARLRYSTEGRSKKVQINGLFLPAAVRQLYRLPLLGYVLRFGVALVRLPALVRHQQQFEAHLHAQQQLIVDHSNHLSNVLSQHQREVSSALAQLNDAARAASLGQQQQLEQLKQEQHGHSTQLKEQHGHITQLNREHEALREALFERLDAVKQQFDVLIDKAVAHWQREMQQLDARHSEQNARALEHVEQLTASARRESEQLVRQLRDEVERIFQKEQEIRTELALQGQRVTRLLEKAQGGPTAPFDNRQLEVMADEQQHLHDAFYLALEESFRGSPAEIKERLKVYLPLVERAHIETNAQPLLDIGCGRGEWLELLRESNVPASGVDTNRVLVAQGRER
ncbi:MAG: DUF4214 domain-containing protein, partial [Pyrinomonadaceae bacterium]|nr:DUF4214 domain-containing protein [Pyrinomonadaceae bacterium]